MSALQIDKDRLDELVYEGEHDEDAIRESYSGRYMYGQGCLGFVGDDGQAWLFTYDLAVTLCQARPGFGELDGEQTSAAVRQQIRELAEMQRVDSMGRYAIWYWPGLTVTAGGRVS